MPYYHWKGVDVSGKSRRGRIFAATPIVLDSFLMKRDIALTSYKKISTKFLPAIRQETVMYLFERLATLLRAGVLVPEALIILRDTMGHVCMQIVLENITQQVEQGMPLHKSLASHPEIFDERMVQMVYIGQETGSLPIATEALATYLGTVLAFKAKIRSAAMVPLISFVFFVAVVAVVIVGIIPMFVSVLQSVNQPLPFVTRTLLGLSSFVRSWQGIATTAAMIILFVCGFKWLSRRSQAKRFYDLIIIRIPFIKDILYDSQRAWFLDSLTLLVRGGLPVVPSLSIAERSCVNSKIFEYLSSVSKAVSVGVPLSVALEQCGGDLFSAETTAIIAIGENIGQLSAALEQTAAISRMRAARSITFLSTVIQPLLFMILGLLVTLLIVAVYAPIFTLSWAI